jgi:hypothetical protein
MILALPAIAAVLGRIGLGTAGRAVAGRTVVSGAGRLGAQQAGRQAVAQVGVGAAEQRASRELSSATQRQVLEMRQLSSQIRQEQMARQEHTESVEDETQAREPAADRMLNLGLKIGAVTGAFAGLVLITKKVGGMMAQQNMELAQFNGAIMVATRQMEAEQTIRNIRLAAAVAPTAQMQIEAHGRLLDALQPAIAAFTNLSNVVVSAVENIVALAVATSPLIRIAREINEFFGGRPAPSDWETFLGDLSAKRLPWQEEQEKDRERLRR